MSSSQPEISSEPPQLNWQPLVLTPGKAEEIWAKMQAFPQVFDDFGRGNYEEFLGKLLYNRNVFIDIGPGLGLGAGMAVRPGLDTVLHLIMFDRRLRGREPVFVDIMKYFFQALALRRMTAMLSEDMRTGIKLLQRLGFVQEGLMRQAMKKDGKFVNVAIFGILVEEFYATLETRAA